MDVNNSRPVYAFVDKNLRKKKRPISNAKNLFIFVRLEKFIVRRPDGSIRPTNRSRAKTTEYDDNIENVMDVYKFVLFSNIGEIDYFRAYGCCCC